MEVYLDNSATTRPYAEVADKILDVLNNNYGNPSSLHRIGKKAEDALTEARKVVADCLGSKEKEIIFTSGGTESDNLAIIGSAMAYRKNGHKLITQKTEHKAVLESFRFLEENGFEVYYADVDENGIVDADDIINHIDEKTTLVSIMHANNETGAVMPVEKIYSALDHSKCLMHIDAVQTFGKIPVTYDMADMISISSHKIHGPNGVGALYVKSGVRLLPLMYGGSQETGLRSGTENIAGICGFAKACEVRFSSMEDSANHIKSLKERLTQRLLKDIENVKINSPKDSIYSILNVSFTGIKSEVLLHILESKGIYVSTGSACNSKKKLNYVLKAMGLKDKEIDGAIRMSFCEFNTAEEIDYVADVLKKEVPILRKIMR